jgi:hypothetical protein
MPNAWLAHVKKTMKHMKSKGSYKKGDGLKKVIMEAKKTWKKHGGADPAAPAPATGGRRTRKVRRHGRR